MKYVVAIIITLWLIAITTGLVAAHVENYKKNLNGEYVNNLLLRAEKVCGTSVEYFAIEKGDLRVGCRGEL